MKQTPCASRPNLFFTEGPTSIATAKSICSTCPVQEQCLNTAIKNQEVWGVWGGVNFQDPKERPEFSEKLCRGKKHKLPIDHKGECKECRKDARRAYELKHPKKDNRVYVRQQVGDTCKNGHKIVGDNVLIRTYDKAVTCKKCNTAAGKKAQGIKAAPIILPKGVR